MSAQTLLLVDELAAGVEAIESLMSGWESEWWLWGDQAGLADDFDQLEREVAVLGRLGKSLEDGVALSKATTTAATARRAVEELYDLIKGVSGMGYVGRSGILADMVGRANVTVSTQIGTVQGFLEEVIDQVLDDAWDSLETAIQRETAIAGVEEDPDVVNADGKVHLSNASSVSQVYLSTEDLKDVSARKWCEELAADAAEVIRGAISLLDDPEEARECVGQVDRSVFANSVLLRAVANVVLGHIHQTGVFDSYENALETASVG